MRLFLHIFIFFILTPLWSQTELHVTNYYGFRDGLDNILVYSMRQDSRGFLWLGTKEGLNRFDGFQFKKYFSEKDNPNSLSHNKVFDILEYQPGFLLFATGSGLSVLNTTTGQFENEKIKFPALKSRSGTSVSSMFQDPDKRIWINHSGEIDVFDKDLNYLFRFTDLAWAQSLKGVIIRYENWYMDVQGRLWLPTDASGLQIIDFHSQKIYSPNYNPDDLPYLKYNYLRSFLLDEKNNTLWLGPWGEGLLRFDLLTGKIVQEYFNLPDQGEKRTVNTLLQTFHGTLLFTVDETCYEMDQLTMAYHRVFMSNAQHESVLEGKRVRINGNAMIRSDDHHYWIGGIGLFQLTDSKFQKDLVILTSGESETCSDLIISASGIIYSIYDNGWLVAVDKSDENFKHYNVPIRPHASLTKLCEDDAGKLWIGSTKGVLIFDPASETYHQPSFLPSDLMTANINVLYKDHEGIIWIGTREPFHFYSYDPKSGNTVQVPQEVLRQFSVLGKNGRISSIAEDDIGNIWLVSALGGGILRYEKNADRWTSFPEGKRNYNFLVNKGIVSILPDAEGNLWLSTVFGDGLVCYHYATDSIILYTREQGLLSDYVQTITADQSNNLWLSSEYGVTQFNKNTKHTVSNILFESEQFASESFEAVFNMFNNQLVLGTHDREIFIPTINDGKKAPDLKPLLDRISVNNQEQFVSLDHPVLHLDHTQKNISIDFTAVHFTNADKLRFAYQLAGADVAWKNTSLNRSAQYAALSPGSYIFKLKVADESGNWGADHEMLSFTIVPPFWKSSWFILCVLGTLLCISFWVVRKRIRTIRHEAGLKQKIAETEMMALRAQMNPHFIFNCINSIDSLIQSNDKYHATIYLNKFAKLIRGILDSSKQNTVTLAKDLDTLKLYIEMEQFRTDHKFKADIKADPDLLQDDYKVPPLIIQPYVENAILHGLRNRTDDNGQLSISLKRMNGHIQYIIEDNGVGRMQTQNGHLNDKVSYGMQMSSDRVKLFNQEANASVEISDLTDKGIPSGTRVEVLLKMI
ncbi:MAG: two-component regulator propeller domain-containing protein [Saprospiraceae bacterium]